MTRAKNIVVGALFAFVALCAVGTGIVAMAVMVYTSYVAHPNSTVVAILFSCITAWIVFGFNGRSQYRRGRLDGYQEGYQDARRPK